LVGKAAPDGRCLADVSTDTGQAEIYVESFLALRKRRTAVSSGAGVEPRLPSGSVLGVDDITGFIRASVGIEHAAHRVNYVRT